MVAVGETATEPDIALPVEKFVPVQLVAFVEFQVSVELFPVTIVVGDEDSDAVGTGTTDTLDAHETGPTDCVPEVTVTDPVFVPVVEYDFVVVVAVPVSESVPDHVYVYEPVPPDGTAVQVTFCPVPVEVGDTLHVAVNVFTTVTVETLLTVVPPGPVHVTA